MLTKFCVIRQGPVVRLHNVLTTDIEYYEGLLRSRAWTIASL